VQVGPYRVEGEVARGGAGVLYRARDAAGRSVALKVLRIEGEATARRFAREVRALSRLQHPHVARYYGSGLHHGRPYLAMEFVEGHSLEERLQREGPLPVEEVRRIGSTLCEALEAVHAQGLLHRDLKPANVLQSVAGRTVLTDFGLVKQEDGQTLSLTVAGAFLGTPGYWPPEQARGALGELGPHSDVYGLAATLYALLSGRPPRGGETLVDVLERVTAPVVPLSRADVPPALERAILACLDPEPARRPPLASLRDALGAPTNASLPRRSAARWILAGTGLALALLALGWAAARLGSPPPADPGPPLPVTAREPQPLPPPPPLPGTGSDAALPPWPAGDVELALAAPGAHLGMISELAVDPATQRVLSGSNSGELRVWDLESGEQLGAWFDPEWNYVNGVAFGAAGHLFAVVRQGLLLRVSPRGLLDSRPAGADPTDLDSDGAGRLVTCGPEGVRLWSETQALIDGPLPPLFAKGDYTVARFHPDGGGLALGPAGAWRWTAEGKGEAVRLHRRGRDFADLAFSPDGTRVAMLVQEATRACHLYLYRWPELQVLVERQVFTPSPDDPPTRYARSLCFSPDGSRLFTAGAGPNAQAWALPDLAPLEGLPLNTASWVERVRPGPGRMLFSAGNDAVLRAHDLEDGTLRWRLPAQAHRRTIEGRPTPTPDGLSWLSPKEAFLLLHTRSGVQLLELETGRVSRGPGRTYRGWELALAADGRVFGAKQGQLYVGEVYRDEAGDWALAEPRPWTGMFEVSDLAVFEGHLWIAGRREGKPVVQPIRLDDMKAAPGFANLPLDAPAPSFGESFPGSGILWVRGERTLLQLSLGKGRAAPVTLPGPVLFAGQVDPQRALFVAPGGSWQMGDGRDVTQGSLPNPLDLRVLGRGPRAVVNYGERLEVFDFEAERSLQRLELPPGELAVGVLPGADASVLYVWTWRGAILRYRLTD